MGKLILVFVFFMSFCSLTASEQLIEIKTSGGAERPALKQGGEPYIGYDKYEFKQYNLYGDITLECSGEGWEQCKIDSNNATLKCDYNALFILANLAIKNGLKKGTITDTIDENKKSYKRTIAWISMGYLKTSEFSVTLEDIE